MINSRKIEDLHPHVQSKADRFIFESKQAGIDMIAISTYRDVECQDHLYAQGRTIAGILCACGGRLNPIGKCRKHPLGLPVTNARGGDSYHNYCRAFDAAPIVNGKIVWNNAQLWESIGAVAKACGLDWAGNWKTFKETDHFQFTDGLTLSDFKKGKTVPV